MQVIIDIPEEEYKCVQIAGHIGNATQVSNAIFTGTPLPKGHGRLIDADALKITKELHTETDEYNWNVEHTYYINYYTLKEIREAPTIIEADKEK